MSAPRPSSTHIDPREAKRSLRERILEARDALPPATRARHADAIIARLRAREDFHLARTVLLSLAFRSEWETRPLFDAALALGKTPVVPRVNVASRVLDLYAIADLERDVASGYRGIAEPLAHCQSVAPSAVDWVLVPGVAFDTRGHRIGYGGGYYDRLLPTLRNDARRIAGAFELQMIDRVPAAQHDLQVDAIVTELRTLEGLRGNAS
jgi:5-formyltetrahydrofolate cyclo-ligase